MANKSFPDSKPGEKEEVPASHCPRFTPAPTSPITLKGKQVMSGHKITGIHAIGVEIPKGMSFKELMEQLLEGGEAELEKELDEETRQPETGKCDCPVCDPDKDTVEERLFHPVDQWQHAVDVASDVHDAAGSLEHALFELGENPLAFEASMILSQSLTLLRAIQRKRKEVAE